MPAVVAAAEAEGVTEVTATNTFNTVSGEHKLLHAPTDCIARFRLTLRSFGFADQDTVLP